MTAAIQIAREHQIRQRLHRITHDYRWLAQHHSLVAHTTSISLLTSSVAAKVPKTAVGTVFELNGEQVLGNQGFATLEAINVDEQRNLVEYAAPFSEVMSEEVQMRMPIGLSGPLAAIAGSATNRSPFFGNEIETQWMAEKGIPKVKRGDEQTHAISKLIADLAAPTKPSLIVTVGLKTDGGDLTLTANGGMNPSGNTPAVAADAGDAVV